MPRTPKQTGGPTAPAKPRRSPTNKPNGHGGNGHVSSDEVARKAYEIYQSRGAWDGADFDDWIQAEKQLKENQQPRPAAARRRRTRAADA
jgi:Protein of unknown function (DUF2934)